MKNHHLLLFIFMLLSNPLIYSAGSQSNSPDNSVEYKINVKGTITTQAHPDEPIQVEDVTVNKMRSNIPVFEIPNENQYTNTTDEKTKKQIHKLNIDPNETLK